MGFQRKSENFTCEHCGAAVLGNGYTNHCPNCLWSKHVDVDPGDRLAACAGLMKPLRIEGIVDRYVIVQKCEKCGLERKNKAWPEDMEAVVKLAATHASK